MLPRFRVYTGFENEDKLGKPYEESNIARKIVKNCTQESFVSHLHRESVDNRLMQFNNSLHELKIQLGRYENSTIKKVVLPIGIGNRLVNPQWLCNYYEIIKKFARDI